MIIRRRVTEHRVTEVEVWSSAKLNLYLEVLAKRSDGYHEIETLMVGVDVWDTLTAANDPSGELTLDCRWALGIDADKGRDQPAARDGAWTLPPAERNLAWRAVELFRQRVGERRGLRLALRKRIPPGAGLGGASSDAAAALIAANAVWGIDWPMEKLVAVAAELGSDVPFFLTGGAAVCRGRGELIAATPVKMDMHVVVVWPEVALSTAGVYDRCRPTTRPRSATRIVSAWNRGSIAEVADELHNGLETAACELSPAVERLRHEFAAVDCLGHGMSGSGSSWFGVCRNRRQAVRVAAWLRGRRAGWVLPVRTT